MKALTDIFFALGLLLLITGCGGNSPPAVPVTPGASDIPPASLPSPTPVPEPTANRPSLPSPIVGEDWPAGQSSPSSLESVDGISSIYVPQGNAATIDGVFSSGEWDDALTIELSSGELLLMHAGGYLYVGIRSDSLGLGSVCVNWDDEISILHSSAALGTATYLQADDGWVKVRGFTWTNRETFNSQQALEARREHLQRESWLASNGRLGTPGEMEYQIAMTNDEVHLAVTYLLSPGYQTTDFWPEKLGAGCREFEPLQAGPPEMVSFAPETWMTVIASPESLSTPQAPSTP